MNISIFGATGKTGQQLTQQALDLGHTVTALARTPSKLTIQSDRLTIIQGDVLNQADVDNAVSGQDAVICSLGSNSIGKGTLRTDGTANIIKAMQSHSVERLIVISSLGSGDSMGQMSFAAKTLMKTLLRNVIADHATQEAVVMQSNLNWTIVRPSGLTDSEKTGSYKHGLGNDPKITGGRIARADVAEFTLLQLESDMYARKAVSLT